MRIIIYSLLLFMSFPFVINSKETGAFAISQPKPTYFQIYNNVERISSDLFKSKPGCSLYIYSNTDGERWIKCVEPTLKGLKSDSELLTKNLSLTLTKMLLGFANQRRDFPMSIHQYVGVLESYGIYGFEWETKDYNFNFRFEDVINN